MKKYQGIGASAGIGIGTVRKIREPQLPPARAHAEDPDEELSRFRASCEGYKREMEDAARSVRENVGRKGAEIVRGQLLLLNDPELMADIERRITEGSSAESAVADVCDRYIRIFCGMEDEVTSQRADDVRDCRRGLLRRLLGVKETDLSDLPEGSIVAAADLTPSQAGQFRRGRVTGIVTESGGRTSHLAIMARALEIPAVLSAKGILEDLREGEQLIVDGGRGLVIADPAETDLEAYASEQKAEQERRARLEQFRGKLSVSADGYPFHVHANIGTVEDAERAVAADAEGIGLLRTEFLFLGREDLPGEEEQFEAYRKIALRLGGRILTVRTLDAGGDKEIPGLKMRAEENPFLGNRAIRYCLGHEGFFKVQLRAILRAGVYGRLRILLPMVSCVEEVRRVRELLGQCMEELRAEGREFDAQIPVGVMMETPSAAMIADLLAAEADFFSIGTNDLTGYIMSADRGNPEVSCLNSVCQPAVLRAIRQILNAATESGIPVGMCGEAAADERMIPLLMAMGLKEFSVDPSAVLQTRGRIAEVFLPEAEKLMQRTFAGITEREIAEILSSEGD